MTILLSAGCADTKKTQNRCKNPSSFEKLLLDNFCYTIDKNKAVVIDSFAVYFLYHSSAIDSNSRAMVHFIKESGAFVNLDFDFKEIEKIEKVEGTPKKVIIYKQKFPSEKFSSVAIGEYSRINRAIDKDWDKVVSEKDRIEKKILFSGKFHFPGSDTLLREEFKCQLEDGAYFKNNRGYEFILGEHFFYVFKPSSHPSKYNFMIHFLREKQSNFINNSFTFDNEKNVFSLEFSGSKIQVAKIALPESFDSIRIGEFNSHGNQWVQFLDPDDIRQNPLLKYDNFQIPIQ